MAITNQEIVSLIREARLERRMTQQQLAAILGRTASAISDLERGKVQVSASDLSILASALNKPIEFFYGEDIGDNEIEDLIAILRKQTPEIQKQTLATTKMLLKMQQLADDMSREPDKQPSIEEIRDFVGDFITYTKQINSLTARMNKIRDDLFQALKDQGIDILG